MSRAVKFMKQMVALFWGLFKDITDMAVSKMIVTSDVAKELLKTQRYPRQRPLRNATIALFHKILEFGGFIPGSELIFAVCNGHTFLLNGYHRITAVSETGITMLFAVKTYYCATMAQVHRLYVAFDNGIGTRSKDDMFVALFGLSVLKQLTKKQIRSLISASMMISGCFNQSIARIQTHETMSVLLCAKKFMPTMLKYLKIVEAPNKVYSTTLLYQAILSVALVTLEWQPQKAAEFWNGVAHNGVVGANDSRQLLRELLIKLQATRRNSFNQRKGVEAFTPNQITRVVAWCWNKFFKGEKPKTIDVTAAGAKPAIVIEGTPFRFSRNAKEFTTETAAYHVSGAGMDKYVKRSQTGYSKPKTTKKKTTKKAAGRNAAVAVAVSVTQ